MPGRRRDDESSDGQTGTPGKETMGSGQCGLCMIPNGCNALNGVGQGRIGGHEEENTQELATVGGRRPRTGLGHSDSITPLTASVCMRLMAGL